MATSLSNLADNLTEPVHKIKCKIYDWFFEYESLSIVWQNINVYFVTKIIQTKFIKK